MTSLTGLGYTKIAFELLFKAEMLVVALYVQIPPTQTYPVGQVFPQLPQFVTLVLTSTQVPLQSKNPFGHVLQTPPTQTLPGGQVCPQVPQLLASVFKFTQLPAQFTKPGGQLQTPPIHILPGGHVLLQLPQ